MSDLPFSISPEAAAYIEASLRLGDKRPETDGLLPSLCQSYNFRTWHDGYLMQQYSGESWGLGYHDPEEIAPDGYVPLELCGRTIWVSPDGLASLKGKRLVVERVAVGVPNPEDKYIDLLRAV